MFHKVYDKMLIRRIHFFDSYVLFNKGDGTAGIRYAYDVTHQLRRRQQATLFHLASSFSTTVSETATHFPSYLRKYPFQLSILELLGLSFLTH